MNPNLHNSLVLCDCCLRVAVYYRNAGNYQTTKRCSAHVPSTLTKAQHDSVGNDTGKHWVHISTGVKITDKKKIDEKVNEC